MIDILRRLLAPAPEPLPKPDARMALAALLGPTAFGHYVIGLIWLEAGKMLYSAMMGRIAYPAFSEVALSRKEDLPGLYRRLQRLGDAYLLVAFLILHFGASTLIGLLYTDAYADAAQQVCHPQLIAYGQRWRWFEPLIVSPVVND